MSGVGCLLLLLGCFFPPLKQSVGASSNKKPLEITVQAEKTEVLQSLQPSTTEGCVGGGNTDRNRKRIYKLVQRSGSVLDCPLEPVTVISERSMLQKPIMGNPLHHHIIIVLCRRPCVPRGALGFNTSCLTERFRRFIFLSAIRL